MAFQVCVRMCVQQRRRCPPCPWARARGRRWYRSFCGRHPKWVLVQRLPAVGFPGTSPNGPPKVLECGWQLRAWRGVGGWVGGLGKQCHARGWNRGRPGSRRCPKPQPPPSFGSPGASGPRGMERTNPKSSTSPSGGAAAQPSQTPRLWAVGCLLPTHCGRGCTDEP